MQLSLAWPLIRQLHPLQVLSGITGREEEADMQMLWLSRKLRREEASSQHLLAVPAVLSSLGRGPGTVTGSSS